MVPCRSCETYGIWMKKEARRGRFIVIMWGMVRHKGSQHFLWERFDSSKHHECLSLIVNFPILYCQNFHLHRRIARTATNMQYLPSRHFTFSKSTIKTLEQGVKYVQS